jgi:drug/metabolite transporter (DMT)-like permease
LTTAWLPPASAGIALSLATAALWAVSPLCFASAGRRIGSWHVVILRALFAALLLILLLPAYGLLSGAALEVPTASQVLWLLTSALTGMVFGDVLGFESLVILGPRRTMQVLMLAPVASVLFGWWLLGETLGLRALVGIALVLAASTYAVLARPANAEASREPGRVSLSGVLMAVGAAIFVGAGAVAGRQAFRTGPPLDAFLATTIRVASCAAMLWTVPVCTRAAGRSVVHLRDPHVQGRLALGVLCGPFGGMLTYVFALKHLEAGLVSTLAALSPLFMLPLVAARYRTRLGLGVVLATAAAAAGVAMISIR